MKAILTCDYCGNTFYEEDTVGVAQCGNCGELMPVVIT